MSVQMHEVKSHPEAFQAMRSRQKLADFRRDDRDPPYAVGDYLFVREWDPEKADAPPPVGDGADGYTDSHEIMRIMHKTEGGTFGIPDDYCMLSLWPMHLVSGGGPSSQTQ